MRSMIRQSWRKSADADYLKESCMKRMIAFMNRLKMITALCAAVLLGGCGMSTTVPEPADPSAAPAVSDTVTITNLVDFNVLQETADLSGYRWMNDPNPAFTEISLQESIRFFTEGGSGILVYSAETCPFCNRAMPVLNTILKEKGVKAYYVDTNMPIASDSATSMAIYNELVTHIESIFETNDEGERIFQIPEVIAIKDGQIVGHHLSLVDSFTITDEDAQMNEAEVKELSDIYRGLIDACAD